MCSTFCFRGALAGLTGRLAEAGARGPFRRFPAPASSVPHVPGCQQLRGEGVDTGETRKGPDLGMEMGSVCSAGDCEAGSQTSPQRQVGRGHRGHGSWAAVVAPQLVTDGARVGAQRGGGPSASPPSAGPLGGVRNPLCCCPAGWRSGR